MTLATRNGAVASATFVCVCNEQFRAAVRPHAAQAWRLALLTGSGGDEH